MFAIALPFLGGIGVPECLIIVVILLLSIVPIWLMWKIFERTGLPTWYAFLVLIPWVGWLVALAILAFSPWSRSDAGTAVNADVGAQSSVALATSDGDDVTPWLNPTGCTLTIAAVVVLIALVAWLVR